MYKFFKNIQVNVNYTLYLLLELETSISYHRSFNEFQHLFFWLKLFIVLLDMNYIVKLSYLILTYIL